METTFMQKIELRFWDLFLPILTRSQLARKFVRASINFYHNEKLVRQVALILIIACAGFASGILIYTISSVL